MKKFISILLALTVFVSLTACSKKESGVKVPEEPAKVSNRYNEDSTKWTETHRFASTEKDEYIVKNGVSEYKILVPELTTFTTFARDELIRFFYEAALRSQSKRIRFRTALAASISRSATPTLSERADLP